MKLIVKLLIIVAALIGLAFFIAHNSFGKHS